MKKDESLRDIIENAIVNTKSMSAAARHCGVPFRAFIRCAKKWNLYKPNQSGKGILKADIYKFLCENSSIRSLELKNRLVNSGMMEYKCSWCGISEWRDKSLTLELDHINGINNDNRIDNIRILCPNCHSQTETFRGKNKGKSFQKKYTDEQLKNAVIDSETISAVCRKIGLVDKGANIASIRDRIKELGLELLKKTPPAYGIKSPLWNVETNKNSKSIKKCSCGKIIKKSSTTCYDCMYLRQRKVKNRPSHEELIFKIENQSMVSIGKEYGVSDSTIRKWMRQYEK